MASEVATTRQSAAAGTSASSRITVVCAECKRLKLKCDRRTPCASCIKRDTISRCQYSAAAAEKIDVQSLHNRILQLEGVITQLTSGKMKILGDTNNDRTLLATSASGSSVVISVDDIANVWFDQLDVKEADLRVIDLEMRISHSHPERALGEIFPPIRAFLPPDGGATTTACVTPELLSMLPPESLRDTLLSQLEFTLSMHPSLNFLHFRNRVMALFAQDLTENPPSLSFFAAAAAGFALGAQAWLESNHISESEKVGHAADPDRLWGLSKQSLSLFELSCQHDLDFMFASLMQCLYLLHDGKPRISHTLYPILGKLVNIARVMGLNIDPDEHNKHSLFDAEMRRRAWWDLYYYDIFISDMLGQDPTIHDATHTTRLPADVDEDNFNPTSSVLPAPNEHSNFTYFIQRCKLAKLIKTMKKRTFTEPGSTEPSLDAVVAFETEVTTWLNELPPMFKYRTEGNTNSLLSSPHALIAQRCELVTLANALILKLFTPFLKNSSAPLRHHASHSCTNAAHIIISASNTMLSVYNHSRPASFLFYPFGRQIFIAAVVVARVVIQAPQTIYAKVALKDLQVAVDLLKDPLVATSRGPLRGGVEGTPSEALRIVTLLLRKAEASVNEEDAAGGLKRKHTEVGENLPVGLHVPYISGSVELTPEEVPAPPTFSGSAIPPQSRTRHVGPRPSSNAAATWAPPSSCPPSTSSREPQVKEKPRSHYPSIGIRVRHSKSNVRPASSLGSTPVARIPPAVPGSSASSSSRLPPPPAPSASQPPVPRPPPPRHTHSSSHIDTSAYATHGAHAPQTPMDSMPPGPMLDDFSGYMQDQTMDSSSSGVTPYLVGSHASSTQSLFDYGNMPGTSSSAPPQSYMYDASLNMITMAPPSSSPSTTTPPMGMPGSSGSGSGSGSNNSPTSLNPHTLQQNGTHPPLPPPAPPQRSRYSISAPSDHGISGHAGKTDMNGMSVSSGYVTNGMQDQAQGRQDPMRSQPHNPPNPLQGYEPSWDSYNYQ